MLRGTKLLLFELRISVFVSRKPVVILLTVKVAAMDAGDLAFKKDWFWISDGSYKALANIDRMPIHHKALEKRRITRKKKPKHEGRSLTRSRTLPALLRNDSKAKIAVPEVQPTTPLYLKDQFDYDKSSSSEDNNSEDEKDKGRKKSLDISQKIYLGACSRDDVTPRQKILTQLTQELLDTRDFLLTPDDIVVLSYALTTNMCVSCLDLSGNHIGREGAECLVDMLEENMTITELKLGDTKLGLYEVSLITEMLSENLRLETLEISGNNLDDECAKCFAEALKYNRKLKRLNLSSNSFHDNGGRLLAKAIETNDSITDLDLSWNHIRRDGAIAWGDTITNNEELQTLNLSWNGFGDEGAIAVGEALLYNTSLHSLDLSSNRIGYDGCKAISRSLRVNTTLRNLALSQNPVSTQGSLDLLAAIIDNEETKMNQLVLEGIQVLHDTEELANEIKGDNEDFGFIHSGFVISPDAITYRPQQQTEHKCKSNKT